MKVLIILLSTFIVFIITNIIQCVDVTFTTRAESDSFYALKIDRPRHLSATADRVQYCRNYNYNVTLANKEDVCDKCYSDLTYKFVCLIVFAATEVLSIWIILRQRTKIERKLFAKLEHLLAVLNAVSVGVITTDSQKNITFLNNTAGKMCGLCPKMAIGKPIDDVVLFKTNKVASDDVLNLNVKRSTDDEFALVLQSYEGTFLDVQRITSPLGTSGAVMVLLDVTAARAQVRQLSHRAAHDALTGLPNRHSFEKCLRKAMNKEEVLHTIVYIDLDGFKMINDTAGHAAGDALLTQVSQLMRDQLRHTDFVARLGGDEFGLILFNCGLQQAKVLMDLLVNKINDYQFCWEGEVLHFGASAGITSLHSRNKDVGKLLAEADAACYAAKRRGKGQVCLFNANSNVFIRA